MRNIILFFFLIASPVFAEQASDYVADCDNGDQQACLRGAQLAQQDGQTDLLINFSDQGCTLGNTISCSDRGIFHITGTGGPVDVAKGLPLIQQGCEGDYSRACANLGWLYYTGTGVEHDIDKALHYYGKGCDGLSGAACANLALMYTQGDGVTADADKAEEYFDRACELGHQPAC